MPLNQIIKENKYFLIPYAISLIAVLPLILFIPKGELHLCINSFNSHFFDFFFKYLTNLGDGLFSILCLLVLLFISYHKSLMVIVSYIISGVLVQIIKHTICYNVVRPVYYFHNTVNLHLVEGIKQYSNHSFPSGHAASIFALCFCLSCFTKIKGIKLMLFFLALLVAFSRVYLSQHFVIDIYFGSLIGTVSALPICYVLANVSKKWMQNSLRIDLKKKKNK